ncbi:HlyD family secretion protein [Magnetospira thiophila]
MALLVGTGGCGDETPHSGFQGYGEGDFIYLSAYEAGNIETLSVVRGDQVAAGQLVFTMESVVQANLLRQAEGQLDIARHRLADLLVGKRDQEIAVLIAGRQRADAALKLAKETWQRKTKLFKDGIISQADLDQAKTDVNVNQASLDELNAQISTARLAARAEEVAAAKATVKTATAALETAQWKFQKHRVTAPKAGRIEDVLFEEGEFVQPGQPVLSLLPDAALKVRFFIPERRLGEVQIGQAVTFTCDGCPPGQSGTIRFISEVAEFTPPVIFSQPSQQKLVFMAEAWPTGQVSLHPGQPVEVQLSSPVP